MTLHRTLALFALAVAAWPAPAQDKLTGGKPEDVGMSADVLKQGVALFQKAVADDDIRGAVLLVARKGKVVVLIPVGWRNLEKREPMQKDTVFHVASNTKPVVAAAALMLVEDGKLDLDAEVRKYLPSFNTDKAQDIKVRHLLTHTAGFRIPEIFLTPLVEKSADHPDAPSLRIEVDRFGALGAEKQPGTTFSYSNAGYNTLGAVIEVASGKPLEKFLTTRIYEPLGMTDTAHRNVPDLVDRRACIYRKKDGVPWKTVYKPGDPETYPFVRGSGGMLTTAENYARFLQMFENGGIYDGQRLLKAETVRQATEPLTKSLYSEDEQKKRTAYYGFGWRVETDGLYMHSGSDGTYAWVDPKNEVIGVVFTQSPGGNVPFAQFVKLVRQSIKQ